MNISCLLFNIYLDVRQNQLGLESLFDLEDLLLLVIQHCLENQRRI